MAKRKHAIYLAKDRNMDTRFEFYDHIIHSMENGQRRQVSDLFNAMNNECRQEFLIDHLDVKIGHHKSVMNTCIKELTNY